MRSANHIHLGLLIVPLLFAACQSTGGKDTLADLQTMQVDIKEEKIEGGLDKAMEGYKRFLDETPKSSSLSPEAIRRLADLKLEKEYGVLSAEAAATTAPKKPTDEIFEKAEQESDADFEKRASALSPIPGAKRRVVRSGDDLERPATLEAIKLYKKLLKDYPNYERNDQVLYQMSRAYEELGRVEDAMKVMNQFVRLYPNSHYIDEVQFRRAEYFFTRRKYLDAEDAYGSIVTIGAKSSYYQLALYKLGWTFYKQELYEDGLDRFIALLDYKVTTGYDFEQTKDKAERKRTDDTFRVISLSFSNIGGAKTAIEYFASHGKRSYEDGIYSNLGEFYFDKRRYSDAAASYNAFVSRNPFHKSAPKFHKRVIEIQIAGGFPSLVIDAKKQFARDYGLKAEYWKHFKPADRPEVLVWLKTNLTDLAKHYHALYQKPKLKKEKQTNFAESLHWYREFLASFPKDPEAPAINYLVADLLMENHSYDLAAVEYEKTAYVYPSHKESAKAGYAAIYAWRQHLKDAAPQQQDQAKRDVVRSSLIFADAHPTHEKAVIVLGAAADDLYGMKEYEWAASTAQGLIDKFPKGDGEVLRSAWLVVGHSTYELKRYNEAETAYGKVLAMLPPGDKSRKARIDNLASAIYKQGEEAKNRKDYKAASEHFLRVGSLAPASKIRVNAEYDGAAALIQLKDWNKAEAVMTGFRALFPNHALQPEVTKKLAYVYREDKKFSQAADEYERMEKESKDVEVRREALLVAAELHEKTGDEARTLAVYQRYVELFPHPVEQNLETRNKIALALKKKNDQTGYLAELKQIVSVDKDAGDERTPRTRFLAGNAALVLAEQTFDRFAGVKLIEPIAVNLRTKKNLMKVAIGEFNKLVDYEIGDVTAAATYYLAEIYARFNKDLMGSERPTGLSAEEQAEYDLAIEEQAYPFEEKAIAMHKSNLELISRGVYNEWIDKSLQKLAKLSPARYDKPEEESEILVSPDAYEFAVARPEAVAPQVAQETVVQAGAVKEDSKPEAQPEANPVAAGKVSQSEEPQQETPNKHVTSAPSATAK